MANLASTYNEQGRWGEAEKLEVEVMEARKDKFGSDHPDTLRSMANLAFTYSEQNRWHEAEKLEVQVMEGRITRLGSQHPDTLMSMGNLACIYRNLGRWDEAKKLKVQVIHCSVDSTFALTSISKAIIQANENTDESDSVSWQITESSASLMDNSNKRHSNQNLNASLNDLDDNDGPDSHDNNDGDIRVENLNDDSVLI